MVKSCQRFPPHQAANPAVSAGLALELLVGRLMDKSSMVSQILAAKKSKSLTWNALANAAGLSEVYTTSACLGENALPRDAADQLATALELSPEVAQCLTKEPLQYRFQEIIYVYGSTLKALIEEKFGPGIMSAIDFTMDVEKVPDPKGDRVKITMNGKFLGYKTW
jgi:cyanate lyase